MKKSIGNNLAPKSMPPEAVIGLVRAAGYDGIELWLESAGYFSLATTPRQARALLATVHAHGLEVSNVSSGLYWTWSFSDRDARRRRKAVEILRRQIELAHRMGAGEILIVAGQVTPEVTYRECYERCLETLAPWGREARAAGVVIGLENCCAEQKFLMGPMEFAAFVDRLGPGFGAHLDVGNIHDDGFPEQWVEELGPRVARVHIKDTLRRRGRGCGSVYTNVFLGSNNWPAIMQALRKIGYDGYIVAEMERRYSYCREQQFYDTAAALNLLMKMA